MDDARALLRALRIERAMSKLYMQKVRSLMAAEEFFDFRRFCREQAVSARCEGQHERGESDRA
jgi:hypothetical protein